MSLIILAVLATGLCGAMAAQEPVLVSVTVKDAQRRLVSGLEGRDFRLFEDGVEQKIHGFSSEPRALSAAVLLDAGLSRPTVERLRPTFASLVEAFSEFDEVAIFSFQMTLHTVVDFTSDKELIRTGLERMEMGADYTQPGAPLSQTVPHINNWPVSGPPSAPTSSSPRDRLAKNMDDAVLATVRLLEARQSPSRKIILLVSDGLNSGNNRVSGEKLLAALRRSDVAIFSIGLDGARLPRGSTSLARYASATGGELFTAVKKTGIEPLYSRITEQARYCYRLSYVPTRPSTVAPVVRWTEVRVSRPGLIVIARDGYLPAARGPRQ